MQINNLPSDCSDVEVLILIFSTSSAFDNLSKIVLHGLHTRPSLPSMWSNENFSEQHREQSTCPHARQWWRRRTNVNLESHIIQFEASVSGIQKGAIFPSISWSSVKPWSDSGIPASLGPFGFAGVLPGGPPTKFREIELCWFYEV